MKKPRPVSNFLWRWEITSTISDRSNFLWLECDQRFWWFNFSPLHQDWFGCSHLCLGAQGGIRQAQPLLLSISEVLFWCCWPLNFQSWLSWSHTSEHDQAAPSQASAPPHKHPVFIKFSMSCIFMCTGALFWGYLVCLMPLGSSALLFPSQLSGVHTFPSSIPLESLQFWDGWSFLRRYHWQGTAKNMITTLFSCSRPQWSAFLWGKTQISFLYLRYNPTLLTRDAKSQGGLKARQ